MQQGLTGELRPNTSEGAAGGSGNTENVLRIPLLKGEGAAKRWVRGEEKNQSLHPSPGPSGHPLPSGEGLVPKLSRLYVVQNRRIGRPVEASTVCCAELIALWNIHQEAGTSSG
jgi:hypothetical protein